MVFVAFTQGFADLGLSSGLIRTKEPTEEQYSSVFFFNLAVSVLLAASLIALSGLISRYYNSPEVKPIARVVSYSFIIYALNSVHLTIFYKNLEVKIIRLSSIVSSLVSGLLGIALAFSGFGVWSLIYAGLIGGIVSVFIIWYSSAWRPKLFFRFSHIKQLMPFGIKVFLVNYLDQLYSKLDVLVIGKIFDSATLGQYYRASSFNQIITKYTSQGLSGVFFPVISKIQDNNAEIRRIFTKSLNAICFLSFLVTGVMFLNAEPLILILFSSKWLPAVSYFKILAFSSYVYPMTIIFNGVLLGTGNSGNQLRLELMKKGIGVIGLFVGFFFGMNGYLWSLAITATLGLPLSLFYVRKALNIPIMLSLKHIYQYSIPVLISGFITISIKGLVPENLWIKLAINTLLFIVIYVGISHILKLSGYFATRKIAFEFINKSFNK